MPCLASRVRTMAIDTVTLNVANGVISGIVLFAGAAFSLVLGINYRYNPFWAVGVFYIIPGLVGILASGIKRNRTYLLQLLLCVVCLICDVTFAVLFYYSFPILGVGILFMGIVWILKIAITIFSGILMCSNKKTEESNAVIQPSNATTTQMYQLDSWYFPSAHPAGNGVGISYKV